MQRRLRPMRLPLASVCPIPIPISTVTFGIIKLSFSDSLQNKLLKWRNNFVKEFLMEHLDKAGRLYKEGRYDEVLTVCEEALRLSHNPDPRLYDQRAAALQRLSEQAHQVAKQYGHGGEGGKV